MSNEADRPEPEQRSLEVQIEIEAAPEEVWQAIATGNGIESWFVPTRIEERAGGEMLMKLGPGLDTSARILAWEAPHRFVYEEDLGDEDTGPQMLTSEWTVESVGGGRTVMRLVSSGRLEGEDWDEFFESVSGGWTSFFLNLKLYVERFAGQPASTLMIDVAPDDSESETFARVDRRLDLGSLGEGDPVQVSIPGAEPVSGQVLRSDENEVSIVVDSPAPGQMDFSAFSWDEEVHFRFHWRIYGEAGDQLAATQLDPWRKWLEATFAGAPVTIV